VDDRLHALGNGLKITKRGPKFSGNVFLPRQKLSINFEKNIFGYILGDFLHYITHRVALFGSAKYLMSSSWHQWLKIFPSLILVTAHM
jgi:hypothetical protein